ncbi:hypothetical protein ACJJTC_010398 [Scirpophaga incertulas]
MDTWSNELGNGMVPNQYNTSMMTLNSMVPLGPSLPGMAGMCLMPEMDSVHPRSSEMDAAHPQSHAKLTAPAFIGPVQPTDRSDRTKQHGDGDSNEISATDKNKSRSKDGRSTRRSDRYDRDRSRRRSRSRDSYRHRNRNNSSRDRNGRRTERSNRSDRRTKWDPNDSIDIVEMENMPGVLPFNVIQQHGMNMSNLSTMPNMMQPSMNIMSNMMPNMMDSNIMMMNQQMVPQPIYFSAGMLLPSLPGVVMPARREKPEGCRTIFIGGLPYGITADVITEIFQRFGALSNVNIQRQGVCLVRFEKSESVEQSFCISGYRFKLHNQLETEATTIFVDYALNHEDEQEFEKNKIYQIDISNRIEPFTPANIASISEKIKMHDQFIEVAPTVQNWLERVECVRTDANLFYSLIQAANNHVSRLFNEKLQLDEEFHALKTTLKDKYLKIIVQFEQVAKILSAAKQQRVSDNFSRQQRRNIEMWSKMTEEVDNIKDEFESYFEDDDNEKSQRSTAAQEKCEELKKQIEDLTFELECSKNDTRLAQDEAERKFEKFKAQFIAQQALQNPSQIYPPLPPPSMSTVIERSLYGNPLPSTPDEMKIMKSGHISPLEGKLISVMTAFLLIHPMGANLDYIVSYVRSILPSIAQNQISQVLEHYTDIFRCKITGTGINKERKWEYITLNAIKNM